ncbi:Astacin (Peptidase family M12A) [Tenacibaculum sp. MAR_2009_124]|uniref:M12 family metallopeptidase n=1 Tax=Tenacibaculum sp. MAR_2009_124 TaxID=1250059 RepID=UPI00089BC2ED|nr:M12 family metallopeptidase [Tenacibaculum sp. MAR_2009_124]SEC83691.1 Astacin (Peptidase family M12A) [Tenacibaculum sp. MAR_2009_124]
MKSNKRSLLVLVCATLLFLSCKEEDVFNPEKQVSLSPETTSNIEVAFPGEKGEVKKGYYLGTEITYEVINGQCVAGGDMLLKKELIKDSLDDYLYEGDVSRGSRSVGRTNGKWPNNTVYYSVAANLPNQERVTDAIAHWEENTNIRFVRRAYESNFILFRVDSKGNCSADLGMQGGMQTVNLGIHCTKGIVIHEIGHSLGLFHEQSRSDRDNYIRINWSYIDDGMDYNFYTYGQQNMSGANYTNSLDFNSIMLYGSYAFAKYGNGYPTITKLDGTTFNGQREGLSQGDIAGINIMYPAIDNGGGQYQNGTNYTINGIQVFRDQNLWWYSTTINRRVTYIQVENINNKWEWKVNGNIYTNSKDFIVDGRKVRRHDLKWWYSHQNKWYEMEYVNGIWKYVGQGPGTGGNQYQNGTNYTINGIQVFRDQDLWWYLTEINGTATYIKVKNVNNKWVWEVDENVYQHNTSYNVDTRQVTRYSGKWWYSYQNTWYEMDYINGKWEYL